MKKFVIIARYIGIRPYRTKYVRRVAFYVIFGALFNSQTKGE